LNPPCGSCPRPKQFVYENRRIWDAWKILSDHDRLTDFGIAKKIPTLSILHFCEAEDLSQEDFRKILVLEDHLFPRILKLSKGKSKSKG